MSEHQERRASSLAPLVGAWLVVGIPFAYGVYQVLVKALALFRARV